MYRQTGAPDEKICVKTLICFVKQGCLSVHLIIYFLSTNPGLEFAYRCTVTPIYTLSNKTS